MPTIRKYAPLAAPDHYSPEEQALLKPFFTNTDESVYVPLIFSPEVVGALCSRTSRAAGDLRKIFLNEYILPFLKPQKEAKETPETWQQKKTYGKELKQFIAFLTKHPVESIFSNPRARSFYAKWLAQYGDDSIAQMAGSHVVFNSLSQIAIKHLEDQRIGLAPIEKSTRYVNYGSKVKGKYLYYVDPTLKELGLETEYREAMDGLFKTYTDLMPKLITWLTAQFPAESPNVIEKKAFDTLRGLLPLSTLSQVAFFGNGQSFEYMVSRCLSHPLGEIRWAGERAYEELFKVVPSFLRRVKDPEKQDLVSAYQEYITNKNQRVAPLAKKHVPQTKDSQEPVSVRLVEFDPEGEAKIIAGMLFSTPTNHASWEDTLDAVKKLSVTEKEVIIDAYFAGRTQRWQKVGRALENMYVRFEIVMNIGSWRDLHRHRMLTQQRQHFSCLHGFDVPPELIGAKLDKPYSAAIKNVEKVYKKIAKQNLDLAQYAVTMAHRLRFMQWQNMRECFWEIELRTIPEGHPDYRHVEQMKFKELEKIYPLLAARMRVNLGEYDFARRGQEEKVQAKLAELEKLDKKL